MELPSTQKSEWPPLGKDICGKCDGTGNGPSEYHYVRGHGIRNDCASCDGRGFITSHCDGRGGDFPQPHTSEATQC